METKSALVGTYSTVVLDTVAQIDLHLALVVHPWYTECDDTLRFHKTFKQGSALPFGMLVVDILNAYKDFTYGLKILSLSWMLGLQ
jgi:hypothetical protein